MSKKRTVVRFENEYKIRPDDNAFYVLGVDVARTRAETAIVVLKVRRGDKGFTTKVVNVHTIYDKSFDYQSICIKKIAENFKAEEIVIDANGLGTGLLDMMTLDNYDDEGNLYPALGVSNSDEWKRKSEGKKIIYAVKTGGGDLSSMIHINLCSCIDRGKIEFLLDEGAAKNRLQQMKKSKKMDIAERMEWLQPYTNTTKLIRQTANLRSKAELRNSKVVLEKIGSGQEKDLFSALEYGMWRIKELEEKYLRNSKKRKNIRKFIMCS